MKILFCGLSALWLGASIVFLLKGETQAAGVIAIWAVWLLLCVLIMQKGK